MYVRITHYYTTVFYYINDDGSHIVEYDRDYWKWQVKCKAMRKRMASGQWMNSQSHLPTCWLGSRPSKGGDFVDPARYPVDGSGDEPWKE
ncbi:MAG: hypothetical protein U5N86_07925 [Planctomycetota bacterium]|nr:hypothetical protein [Planctomycetota bacterium]